MLAGIEGPLQRGHSCFALAEAALQEARECRAQLEEAIGKSPPLPLAPIDGMRCFLSTWDDGYGSPTELEAPELDHDGTALPVRGEERRTFPYPVERGTTSTRSRSPCGGSSSTTTWREGQDANEFSSIEAKRQEALKRRREKRMQQQEEKNAREIAGLW